MFKERDLVHYTNIVKTSAPCLQQLQVSKDTSQMNNIEQINPMVMETTFHSKATKHTFFSSMFGKLHNIDEILDHKPISVIRKNQNPTIRILMLDRSRNQQLEEH